MAVPVSVGTGDGTNANDSKRVVFFTSSCSKGTLYIISYSKIENRYNGQPLYDVDTSCCAKIFTQKNFFTKFL